VTNEQRGVDRGAAAGAKWRLVASLGRSFRHWLAWSSFFAGLLVLYALFVEPQRIVVEQASLELPGHSPEQREGRYRIAFVSDLDLMRPPGRFEERVRARINALEPDLIAFGGDIFGGSGEPPSAVMIEKVRDWLAGFRARDGVVVAWGEQESIWPDLARSALPPNVHEIDAACEVFPAGAARIRVCGQNGMLAPLDVQVANGGRLQAAWGRSLTVGRYLGAGAESWAGVDATVRFRFHNVGDGPGIAVMERPGQPGYRLRVLPGHLQWAALMPDGAAWSGRTSDATARLSPGRDYLARVRVEPGPAGAVVRSRAWPANGPEPENWPIEFLDTSPRRPPSGSVGVVAGGAWTGSSWQIFESLEVRDLAGRELLREEFDDAARVAREWDRPGSARADFDATIVVGHNPIELLQVPDVETFVDLYLAGHTHGGQVRLPFFGPLHLDNGWPRNWSEGLVRLAYGGTWIYVTRGLGSSKVPVRFLCPPEITDFTVYVRRRPPR
jgi:predicted MPP superfamily phosphohydrolase